MRWEILFLFLSPEASAQCVRDAPTSSYRWPLWSPQKKSPRHHPDGAPVSLSKRFFRPLVADYTSHYG